ncbi:MAG: EAL domain-containing protein, partial [Gammaproteobacteria bacterium]
VVQISPELGSVVEVMALADLSCSVAKEEGRSRVVAYRPTDARLNARKDQMQWVGRIQRAIKDDGFTLFCQPICATRPGTGQTHYEVLLRMQDDDGSPISPGLFMPVAERYHLMPALDRWVVEQTIRTLGQWAPLLQRNNAVFAINLSGQSITDERTLDHLLAQLRSAAIDTRSLCFEITETAAISNLSAAQDFITAVKGFGCQFALDDFGAGVSSFTNLRALQLDYLKIDGSFVVDMLTDPISAAMVAAINQVGQTMSLATVAEFVESQSLQDALTTLGVDYLQGYHLGKPEPLQERLERLSETERLRA